MIEPLSLMALLTSFATCGEIQPPPEMCGSECTSAMKAIVDRFDELKLPPSLRTQVYSGECYYQGFDTDPETTQYGFVLLDRQDSQPIFSGLFSFFNSANPYRDLTPDRARALLEQEGSPISPMCVNDSLAEIEYRSAKSDVLYWLRQDSATQELFLLSNWKANGNVRIYCRLSPN